MFGLVWIVSIGDTSAHVVATLQERDDYVRSDVTGRTGDSDGSVSRRYGGHKLPHLQVYMV